MNWHDFGAFAPLMLVMSGPEKYRLVQSLEEAAKTPGRILAHRRRRGPRRR